jgi:hypothetical protein
MGMRGPERILEVTGARTQLRDLLVQLLRRGKYKPMRGIRIMTTMIPCQRRTDYPVQW